MFPLSTWWGYGFVFVVALALLGVILVVRRGGKNTPLHFFVARRSVTFPWSIISPSVSWVWAPALVVASQQAYTQGLPGLIYFTVPNALALVFFAFLGVQIRKRYPYGYTLPEFMRSQMGERIEWTYIVAILIAQLYAVVVNLTGATLVLESVTGISRNELISLLAVMMLILAGTRGMWSSLILDVTKFVMLIVLIGVVFLAVGSSGGTVSLMGGLAGVTGTSTTLFNLTAATVGLTSLISFFAGISMDQQQYQRTFSMKADVIKTSYLWASPLFALFPLMIGVLGILAANVAVGVTVPTPQLAGFNTVVHLVSPGLVLLFATVVLVALLAAGCSALNAIGEIVAVNMWNKTRPESEDPRLVWVSRCGMVLAFLIGIVLVRLDLPILAWLLIMGAVRGPLFAPTLLTLWNVRLSPGHTLTGIILAAVVGVPVSFLGAQVQSPTIQLLGSILAVGISAGISWVGWYVNHTRKASR